MIVAGTGHRPPRLGLGYTEADRERLADFAATELLKLKPSLILSGGAQGWDQALAMAAHRAGIPYRVYAPFEGQDAKWPPDARSFYRRLLADAESVRIVSPGGYANWKFAKRDECLVDDCECLLALLDDKPEKSGTGITASYANSVGRRVVNCWPNWIKDR